MVGGGKVRVNVTFQVGMELVAGREEMQAHAHQFPPELERRRLRVGSRLPAQLDEYLVSQIWHVCAIVTFI